MTKASEKYRACAEKGMTQAETARHLGVSKEAVRQAANRHGIEFECGRYVKYDAGQIVELVEAGASTQQIASFLDCSRWAASRIAKSCGVTPRHGHALPKSTVDEVIRLHDLCMTQKQIADRVGMHQTQVSEILRKNGIRSQLPKGALKNGVPKLLREGKSIGQIAEALGTTYDSIATCMTNLRKDGLL